MKSKHKKLSTEQVVKLLMDNKAIVVLAVLVVVMGLLTPNFFSTRNLTNVIRQVCVSCIIGIGFTLVMGSGQIDLSVGNLMGMLGMAMALMSVRGVPMWLVLVLGVLLGAACGAFNAAVISLFQLPAFIVTLATGLMFKGTTQLLNNSKAVSGIPDSFVAIGQGYLGPIPVPVIIMLAVMVLMLVLVNRTKFGRHCIAVGGNERAARVCGVNVRKVRYLVYMITGVCVAIAAMIMTGRSASAQPTAGSGMEMDAIAAVVIGGTPMSGGKANVLGTVVGCLIVGTISNGLNLLNVNSNWQQVAKGIIIIIAIILDTQGTRILDRIRVKNVEKAA